MLNYPLQWNGRLTGPTLVYIDAEGSLIQLTLDNYLAQSVITQHNSSPDDDLEPGEVPSMLLAPLGHVATYVPSGDHAALSSHEKEA